MGNDVINGTGEQPAWLGRGVTIVFDDTEDGLLPVAEILLQVAALPPGPEAIALLNGLAGRAMTPRERFEVVGLWQPQLAWTAGAEQTALLAYTGPTPDPGDTIAQVDEEFLPVGLAPVLNATPDHVHDRVRKARLLASQFKDLGDLLRSGQLDAYRVHLISEVLTTLRSAEHVAAVQAAILPVAASLTPAKLRKQLRRLAREVDPDWNTAMFAKARKTRRVVFTPEGQDGLVGLHAYLPPVEAMAVQNHLEKAAQTGPLDEGDVRDHEERMCDALIGAVLGTTPGDPSTPLSPDVAVNVLIPAPLLLGITDTLDADLDDNGQAQDAGPRESVGQLEGYGDYPAQLLRLLAADAAWRRWVLEPVTGHLLDLGKQRYKPSAELAEYVRARDRYCRTPAATDEPPQPTLTTSSPSTTTTPTKAPARPQPTWPPNADTTTAARPSASSTSPATPTPPSPGPTRTATPAKPNPTTTTRACSRAPCAARPLGHNEAMDNVQLITEIVPPVLHPVDVEWRYVPLRRRLLYLEHSIAVGLQWTVFEPNGERLWGQVRQVVGEFLHRQWQSGLLVGAKPEEAYFVRCDRTTMTQNDLDNGRLVVLIGLAVVRPAEFVVIQIGQWTADPPC